MPILTLSNNTKRPGIRQNVAKVLNYSNNTKRPGFDIDRTKYGGIDAISADDLKKLNKNKKLARKYEAFVASETLIKQIPRIKVPTPVSYADDLSSKITKVKSTVKLPTPVSHADDLSSKITEVKSTVKF
ncbi:hypothetical protein BT67DRAFT_434981 [Trichocladium antarcticum]|uniref:Uncharacterized protein n=1 Tax=Trichocladium antarcticum TaxID=1450529 RepID=A0AAN6UIS2_9PEZI|nr:hypothetical protein BT67DRAFT_434981 [Trichocladium antarcticum]